MSDHRSPVSPLIRQHARELRHGQTTVAQLLWRYLRRNQLNGHHFRRQYPIGSFIVDFYCHEARLVVEVDGDSHASQEEYDAYRTHWLEAQGCRVVRFTNSEVLGNTRAVLERILELCEA